MVHGCFNLYLFISTLHVVRMRVDGAGAALWGMWTCIKKRAAAQRKRKNACGGDGRATMGFKWMLLRDKLRERGAVSDDGRAFSKSTKLKWTAAAAAGWK